MPNKETIKSVLWNLPENPERQKKGQVLIIGGSKERSKGVLDTAFVISQLGANVNLAVPNVLEELKTVVGKENLIALPATVSGSISADAERELKEAIKAADLIVFGPDLSGNSETLQLIEKLKKFADGEKIKNLSAADDAIELGLIAGLYLQSPDAFSEVAGTAKLIRKKVQKPAEVLNVIRELENSL